MLMFLSPAKSLDYKTPPHVKTYTQPAFLDQSATLIQQLRKLSPVDIAHLMDLSDPLATLNFSRYADWCLPFTPDNAKQAILAFNGDVYAGLAAATLTPADSGPSTRKPPRASVRSSRAVACMTATASTPAPTRTPPKERKPSRCPGKWS